MRVAAVRTVLHALLALGLVLAVQGQAVANPQASLDRDRIAFGETVTFSIEYIGRVSGTPDISALEADFIILQQSSRQESVLGQGGMTTRTLWAASLEPRTEGVIGIPALDWGSGRTRPLSLTVLPATAAGPGDPVFIEVEVDERSPYVQQAVFYTVRLNYRVALLEGRLDAPEADGAELRQIGEDRTYARTLHDRRYNVVERRYLLLPERSGELRVGPPRFRGRSPVGGRSIHGGSQSISQAGETVVLDVRRRPVAAGSPWTPARDLEIELEPPGSEARLGEPLTLTLHVRGEGITLGQLPDLVLPAGAGYQVHPEAPELRERFEDGRMVVEGMRRFVVLPLTGDRLEMPAWGVDWWDVENDRAARAAVPGLELDLLPALVGPESSAVAAAPTRAADAAVSGAGMRAWPWIGLSAVLALGWLSTLAWMLRRPRAAPMPGRAGAQRARGVRSGAVRRLSRALAEGDLDAISSALVDSAPTPVSGLSGVADRLAEARQVQAVHALQAARWGSRDPAGARVLLRSAFASGPKWRHEPPHDPGTADPLPPLYP